MPKDYQLLSEIARMYYEMDLTQQEIGERLFISRSRVSRLIRQAKAEGIVEIKIHSPYERQTHLEREFRKHFQVNDILILDAHNGEQSEVFAAVTKIAAPYLDSMLANDIILGLTWGRTIYGTIQELRPKRLLPNLHVVQMTGAVESSNPAFDGPYLVRHVAGVYGCKYQHLMVPFFVEDAHTRNNLMKRSTVSQTLSVGERADVMCTGIGYDANWGKYMNDHEITSLRKAGAVGYVCGYYFDIDGRIVDTPFYERTIGVSSKVFVNIPYRVGIATGIPKAAAILGALRGGIVNILITDSHTASRVIELDDRKRST